MTSDDGHDDPDRGAPGEVAFEYLRFERDGDVLRVTIDRPDDPLNAVDATMHEELARLFRALKRERTARAVLLTGSGRAFSAGGDFRWFPELQAPGALEELRVDARQLIWDLLDVALPIVCAINGHAVGLGASVALLCDVIFMAESATLADPHVRVGLVAGDGGTIAWPLAVGPARAKQYLLTGDALSAAEAERIGLVNRVVADERSRRRGPRLRPPAGGPAPVGGAAHQGGGEQLDEGDRHGVVRPGHGVGDLHLPLRRSRRGAGRPAREATTPVPRPVTAP